jgi:hypothetical protein
MLLTKKALFKCLLFVCQIYFVESAMLVCPMEYNLRTCASSSYRIDLKIGSLMGLRLCLYYPNQMTVGRVKVAMYR